MNTVTRIKKTRIRNRIPQQISLEKFKIDIYSNVVRKTCFSLKFIRKNAHYFVCKFNGIGRNSVLWSGASRSEPVLFGRSRSQCEGPAPAPPYIKHKKF